MNKPQTCGYRTRAGHWCRRRAKRTVFLEDLCVDVCVQHDKKICWSKLGEKVEALRIRIRRGGLMWAGRTK